MSNKINLVDNLEDFIKVFNEGGGPIWLGDTFESTEEGLEISIVFDPTATMTMSLTLPPQNSYEDLKKFLFQSIINYIKENKVELLLLNSGLETIIKRVDETH